MKAGVHAALDEISLATIFTGARTHYAWHSREIPQANLLQLYDVAKLGPTSASCSPLRVAFVCSRQAKERLLPALSRGNVTKASSAPTIAIMAQDRNYLDRVPTLFPVGYDARSWFTATPASAADHGLRNTMLQAAYFIIAARALGLDCGPMSGFNSSMVDDEFLNGLEWNSLLLINLGYGADVPAPPRRPRLSATDACRFF